MAAFSQRVDVSAAATYPVTPQVTIPFEPKSTVIVLEDAADSAALSFDGTNDHATLIPGTPITAIGFEQRSQKIWLRRVGVGAPPTMVQVVSEA